MGQGQYGKHSSIPDTEVQYIHKDEYGNVHTLTRELSHQERYKTLAKSDDRGKMIMGIHRTFWHKGISATAGRGHKIEKGKGMTYGVFNTTGDEVNSYGRPLTALELLRKKENDKKLALIRAEKKRRSEMYKSQNGSNQGTSSIVNAQNGCLASTFALFFGNFSGFASTTTLFAFGFRVTTSMKFKVFRSWFHRNIVSCVR